MKVKRILSVLLILCLLASFMPGLQTNARAEGEDDASVPPESGSVSAASEAETPEAGADEDGEEEAELMGGITYTLASYYQPEVAILNMFSGASTKFYESIFKDSKYNAVQAGKFKDGSTKLTYDDEDGKNRTYTWAGFADTNLALLSDQTLQLKVNYSTTLRNKIHDHSWWTSPFTKAKQACYGRMTAQLWLKAGTQSSENWTFYAVQHGNSSKNEINRKGDLSYSSLPDVLNGAHSIISTINGEYVRDWKRSDMSITVTNQNYKYDGGDKTCTCGGWARNNVVTFYDGESPKVSSVETRNKATGAVTSNFKPGDTIQVVLKFSEPVRLADHSGSDKSDVCIGLLVNKSASEPLIAKLTSVTTSGYYGWNGSSRVRPTWEAVFEYKVPANVTGLYDIKGISLTTGEANALVHSSADIPMMQLVGNSAFSVTKPSDKGEEGFTLSKSYITDIAGNPLLSTVPAVNFSVDAEKPYVAQVVMNATLNNSGIKERKDEGEPETDNSDTYLGVGDSFTLAVYLNEVVSFDGKDGYNSPYFATATLNILDADDSPVQVPLKWYWDVDSGFLGTQFGLGASNGKVSKLYSARSYTIQAGMHLPEGETDIVIQSITYDPACNVCDASGNPARDETHDPDADPPTDNLAPTMGYRLDTVGPNVTVSDVVQNGINASFYVPFQVVDGTGPEDKTASGAAGMVGSVTLSAATGDKSAFSYAVNGAATTDSETVWKTGHLGEKISIVESGGQQYLHVRPVADARYDFSELTASFYLTDYAGNGVTRTSVLEGVVWDNVKPTTNSETASRVFDNIGTRGVLTVPVTVKDTCGVKNAWYLWADADAEITADSEGWTPLTFTQGETAVTDDVIVYVDNGDSFSQTLWLMAEDMGGNVITEMKRSYSYNLKALQFGLDYTTNVQNRPWIKYEMNSMVPGDGFFIVTVRKADDTAVDENGNPIYWLNVGMDGGFAGGQTDWGGFMDVNFGWHKAIVEKDPTTNIRTFTIIDMDESYGYGAGEGGGVWSTSNGSYGLSEYSGEIEVAIYSGTMQATIDPDEPTDPDTGDPNYTLMKYDETQWGTRWWYNSQTKPIILDNSVGVEEFTLRVVQGNDSYVQYADTARIQCEFTYVDPQLHALTDLGNWWSAPDAFNVYDANSTLAGMKVSFKLTDTYDWDFDGIDWANSYFRLNNYLGQQIPDYENDLRISGITPGQSEQTIIFPAVDIPAGRYDNMTLFLARTEQPDCPYQFYVKTSDMSNSEQEIEVDSTEPGSLVPGLLSYQPYTKFFNWWDEQIDGTWTDSYGTVHYGWHLHIGDGYDGIETEKSEDFPRQIIEYNPESVIYIPADNVRVDLTFQALSATDEDGDGELDPAYRRGRQAGYGQYDAVAWNTSADDPESTLTYLQGTTEQNFLDNEKLNPCYDAYDTETAVFRLDDYGDIETVQYGGQDYGLLNLTLNATGKNLVKPVNGTNFALPLIPDQDNVIAVQMRYVNGKTSDIVFLTIHPVSSEKPQGTVTVEPAKEDEHPTYTYGTVVGESGETTVRYTPAEGENTTGMRFWLCNGFYRNIDERTQGISRTGDGCEYWYNLDVGNPIEMTLQGDGSYLGVVPDYDNTYYGVYARKWADGDKTRAYGIGLRHYVVVAQDPMGALWVLPSPMNSILTDSDGPLMGADTRVDASDGTYSFEISLSDESLFANTVRRMLYQNPSLGYGGYSPYPDSAPVTLTFSFDEVYSELTGAGSFTVVYDPAEVYTAENVTYKNNSYWTAIVESEIPVEGNTMGITSITARLEQSFARGADYGVGLPELTLTVKGAISQKLTEAMDVEMCVKAEDMYGHKAFSGGATTTKSGETEEAEENTSPCEVFITLENAVGAEPHFVSAEYKLTGNTTDGWQQDRALYMYFSGPVQLVASWICPQPKGYEATWVDGFPITKDGEWTISYYDMLDNLHTETITLTDVFGDYGIDLDFSTLDFTEEAITISVTPEGNQDTPHGDSIAILPLPADLQSFEDREYGMNPNTSLTSQKTVEENGDYVVLRAPYNGGYMAFSYLDSVAVVNHAIVDQALYDYVWHTLNSRWHFSELGFRREFTDYLVIHIGNYVNGAPGETINIFFGDNGRQYTAPLPESRQGMTDSEVIVSYTTSRDTEPVGDGEISKTFRAGDDDYFEFTYYDPATDAEYTISGRLSDYGVTLTAPEEPPEDTRAPEIGSVTVWKQIGSRFERAEAFRGDSDESEIEDVFSVYVDDAHPGRCGWASGYDLVLSVSDISAWKLLLCDSEPAALTYDTECAAITGVTLQGNNVLISQDVAGEFWIAAVDENDNFSFFRLDANWFHFDLQAPVLTASETVVTDFYERAIFLKVSDDHSPTGGITVTGMGVEENDGSNAAYPAAEWPYMIAFTENTANVPVTATDEVGNSSIVYLTVDGIDTTKPTLTVTWSPCFQDPATGRLNPTAPTTTPTNVAVVANISSDKPLVGGDGTVRITAPDYPAFEETVALPYGQYNYWGYGTNPVYYEGSEKLVTVTFADSMGEVDSDGDGYTDMFAPVAYEVTLTLEALNGQKAEVVLNLGAGIVDCYEPYAYGREFNYLYRQRADGSLYDTAYACNVSLTFTEDVYLSGGEYAGRPEELHTVGSPYTYTVYDNDEHALTMTDKAGNVVTDYIAPPSPEPMDSEAPVLSIFNEDELTPVGSTAVTVKVRIGEDSGIDSITVSNPTAVTFDATYADDDDNWQYDAAEDQYYLILPLAVSKNGTYRLTVVDKAGNTATMIFSVSNLDRTLPTIRFETPTVMIRQGSTPAELAALLDAGVALWDNVDDAAALAASLSYDMSGIDLSVPGTFAVEYTVSDSAGNIGSSVRMVRIISAKLPEVRVDGRLTELNGTLSLRPGVHTLTVTNLSGNEPYTIKLVKGIWSEGQLKYVVEGIAVAEDGSFTLPGIGFYTLYILTQSRVSYRTLLYADN